MADLFKYHVGVAVATIMQVRLQAVCKRVEVAGSIRRRVGQVHDVDLVVWPVCEAVIQGQLGLFGEEPVEMPVGLLELMRVSGWLEGEMPRDYPRKLVIPPCEWDGEAGRVPVELYLCEPDGSNFEALLQMRTGSAEFNVSLAERAKRIGLRYKAGYGIFDGVTRVDDGTEKGIFTALGIDKWYEPENRGGDWRYCKAGYWKALSHE